METKLLVKRKESRLKQSDVANKIGIHKQSYYLKENGIRPFTITEARRLAKVFRCSLDDLF